MSLFRPSAVLAALVTLTGCGLGAEPSSSHSFERGALIASSSSTATGMEVRLTQADGTLVATLAWTHGTKVAQLQRPGRPVTRLEFKSDQISADLLEQAVYTSWSRLQRRTVEVEYGWCVTDSRCWEGYDDNNEWYSICMIEESPC